MGVSTFFLEVPEIRILVYWFLSWAPKFVETLMHIHIYVYIYLSVFLRLCMYIYIYMCVCVRTVLK